ncbi:MAG: dockerin type I domain-containing protein [Candidatus Aureabacteria bacterium]|nr:dockerin type I domain-containing protein [Candidatus Auribacterota bacterium]
MKNVLYTMVLGLLTVCGSAYGLSLSAANDNRLPGDFQVESRYSINEPGTAVPTDTPAPTWTPTPDIYTPTPTVTPNDVLRIDSAVSRIVQGGAGEFDIDLLDPLGGYDVAVESRAGGPQMIIVTFSEEIQGEGGFDPSNVSVTTSRGTSPMVRIITIMGKVLVIQMQGATDQSRLTISFPGIMDLWAGNHVTETLCLAVMKGDVTGDGVVNIYDLIAVKIGLDQPVNGSNVRRDVNADGFINIFDLIAVKLNLDKGCDGSCPPVGTPTPTETPTATWSPTPAIPGDLWWTRYIYVYDAESEAAEAIEGAVITATSYHYYPPEQMDSDGCVTDINGQCPVRVYAHDTGIVTITVTADGYSSFAHSYTGLPAYGDLQIGLEPIVTPTPTWTPTNTPSPDTPVPTPTTTPTFTPCDVFRIESAVSRRVHGDAGDFDIDLLNPLAGNDVAVECRTGGPEKLVVAFSLDLRGQGTHEISDVSVTSSREPVPTVTNVSVSGKVLTIDMTGAVDQSRLTISFPGIRDMWAGNAVSETLCLAVMSCDITGDGVVNIFDLVAVKSNLDRPVSGSNVRSDVTADGFVNIYDILAVKLNLDKGSDESCPSDQEPTPTWTPTNTPSPDTPVPTPTNSPTPTPVGTDIPDPAPTATSAPSAEPTAEVLMTPQPTKIPSNYLELHVETSLLRGGDTLKLGWEIDPERRYDLMGRPVHIYFAAAEGAPLNDRPATVNEITTSRSLYLFDAKLNARKFSPKTAAPAWRKVIFPLNGGKTSGNVTLTVPPGFDGTQWVFLAAFVDVASGNFIRPPLPVEVSNEAGVK